MARVVLQAELDWAEDRATQRCDPSAVPGAKTGARAGSRSAPLPFNSLRFWHQSDKPSRHDAATSRARCPSQLANVDRQEFQFPVNQDTRSATSLRRLARARTSPRLLAHPPWFGLAERRRADEAKE